MGAGASGQGSGTKTAPVNMEKASSETTVTIMPLKRVYGNLGGPGISYDLAALTVNNNKYILLPLVMNAKQGQSVNTCHLAVPRTYYTFLVAPLLAAGVEEQHVKPFMESDDYVVVFVKHAKWLTGTNHTPDPSYGVRVASNGSVITAAECRASAMVRANSIKAGDAIHPVVSTTVKVTWKCRQEGTKRVDDFNDANAPGFSWTLKLTVWDIALTGSYAACPAFRFGGAALPKLPKATPLDSEMLKYFSLAGITLDSGSGSEPSTIQAVNMEKASENTRVAVQPLKRVSGSLGGPGISYDWTSVTVDDNKFIRLPLVLNAKQGAGANTCHLGMPRVYYQRLLAPLLAAGVEEKYVPPFMESKDHVVMFVKHTKWLMGTGHAPDPGYGIRVGAGANTALLSAAACRSAAMVRSNSVQTDAIHPVLYATVRVTWTCRQEGTDTVDEFCDTNNPGFSWTMKLTVLDAYLAKGHVACSAFRDGGTVMPRLPKAPPIDEEMIKYFSLAGINLDTGNGSDSPTPSK